MSTKVCRTCNIEKSVSEFSVSRVRKNGIKYYELDCKKCSRELRGAYLKKYYEDHKEEQAAYQKKWYLDNRDRVLAQQKEYNLANPEKRQKRVQQYNESGRTKAYNAKYREDNKEELRIKDRIRKAKRYDNDPEYRFRKIFSGAISKGLKRAGSKKIGSILKNLPYSMKELREYLELLFEPWMTHDNYGPYDKNTWKDDDQATWTWNIDHIIPQSELSYKTMDDENFQKCWALINLRPYSAEQNLLEGASLSRHQNKTKKRKQKET